MNCGGRKPKLSFLKVWGCDAYVKRLQPDKLEPKSEKCVFIGYPKETIGTPSTTDLKARSLLPRMEHFREGVSLERSEWEESRT